MKLAKIREKSKDNSIVLIISSLKGGGAERVAINLANYFAKKFDLVYLIILCDQIEYDITFSKKVNVINLGCKKAKFSFYKLIRKLNSIKPKYILSIMRDSNLILSISSFFLYFNKKIIFNEQNSFKSLNMRNSISKIVLLHIYSFLYKRSNIIIACSKDTKKSLLKNLDYKKSKIYVISNPVLEDKFNPENIKIARHKWINNPNLKVIMGAGRLHPQKDFPTLIKAFKIVFGKNQNTRLIICGEGSERKNLNTLIRKYDLNDYIDLIGFTKNLYSYFKGADIFCLTSLYEGFGNVTIEAMALGKFIISTSCEGISREIITNKNIGSLVPIKKYKILAKAILDNLNRERNNELNKEIALKFRVSNIGREYYDVINLIKDR